MEKNEKIKEENKLAENKRKQMGIPEGLEQHDKFLTYYTDIEEYNIDTDLCMYLDVKENSGASWKPEKCAVCNVNLEEPQYINEAVIIFYKQNEEEKEKDEEGLHLCLKDYQKWEETVLSTYESINSKDDEYDSQESEDRLVEKIVKKLKQEAKEESKN